MEKKKKKKRSLVEMCNLDIVLKAVDTTGDCQRIVLTVGVSQHMHNITNL